MKNTVKGHSSKGRKGLLSVQKKYAVSNVKTPELLLKEKWIFSHDLHIMNQILDAI